MLKTSEFAKKAYSFTQIRRYHHITYRFILQDIAHNFLHKKPSPWGKALIVS